MNLHGRSFSAVVAYAVAACAVAVCLEAVFNRQQGVASESLDAGRGEIGKSSHENHCIEDPSNRCSQAPFFVGPTFPDESTPFLDPAGRPHTDPSVRNAGKPKRVLLFFSASWCGPCQQMKPIVDRLRQEGFAIQTVDVDHDRKLTQEHDVTSIPRFIMVVDGKSTEEISGATTEKSLRRLFQMRERRLFPVVPVHTVDGSISDNRLLSVVPYSGIVRDALDWAEICDAWHLDASQNKVDFHTQFVIVKTSMGSSMSLTLVTDRDGDLTCNGIYTADHRPNGFKFIAVVVNREGIKTIHGEPLVTPR